MSYFRVFCASSLAVVLITTNSFAEEKKLSEWCVWRVSEGLLKPLAKRESKRSRFSRGEPAPSERRTRALGEHLAQDAQKRGFMPFAVDVRYGSDGEWSEDITGCVYRATGSIYVAVGDEYFPAEYLLGKRVEAVAGVCVAPKEQS